MANCIHVRSNRLVTIRTNAIDSYWVRQDRPYGTMLVPNHYVSGGVLIGKYSDADSNIMQRVRYGFSFAIPIGLKNPLSLKLKATINGWDNSLETFLQGFYASNTVYSGLALPANWETQADVLIGSIPYGIVTEQRLTLAPTLIGAHAGGSLLMIAGNQAEIVGSGAGIHTAPPSVKTATFGINTFLGMALELQY